MTEAYLRLVKAAQGLDHMDRDTGLEPWRRYMKAYYDWLATL